jgi:hypothetical protein
MKRAPPLDLQCDSLPHPFSMLVFAGTELAKILDQKSLKTKCKSWERRTRLQQSAVKLSTFLRNHKTQMKIDVTGTMTTLKRSFTKQCSIESAVHKIDCVGGPEVHKNMVFQDVGDDGVMRRLLQKVDEFPVSRGTDDHPLGEVSGDRT